MSSELSLRALFNNAWTAITSSDLKTGADKVPVETVASTTGDGFCPAEPSARCIANQEQLPFWARGASASWNPGNEMLLEFCAGRKPTAGYSVHQVGGEAVINNSVAEITVECRPPQPGRNVSQVMTSPALLMKLPHGPFQTIHIKDPAGNLLSVLPVPRH